MGRMLMRVFDWSEDVSHFVLCVHVSLILKDIYATVMSCHSCYCLGFLL